MLLLNEYENDYHTDNATKTCEEIANIALFNQENLDKSTFLGQSINFNDDTAEMYGKKN